MKKKHIWSLLLLVTAFTTFSLFGCRSSSDPSDKDTKTSTQKEDKDTSSDTEEDKDVVAPDTKNVEQTDPSEINGEGTTDDTLPDLTGMEMAPLKQPCVITGESGADLCTLTINSIKVTDERNEEDTETPEKVIIVDYTYENTASEDPLLFDDMSFKLLDGDTVCKPYYLSTLTPAEAAPKGKSSTGQIAFSVGADCKEVTLFFENTTIDAEAAFQTNI